MMRSWCILLTLVLFGCSHTGEPPIQPSATTSSAETYIAQIENIAVAGQCRSYEWRDRGWAPQAYIKGIALVFARSLCDAGRSDVAIASAAAAAPPGSTADRTDGLTWYDPVFAGLGMSNAVGGPDTLRHTYALMIGLGMRESSGRYCVGRDRSADFTEADSAEAGLFQTSWGVHRASPLLPQLYADYAANRRNCYLHEFSSDIQCGVKDAENFGSGTGADWQQLTKTCPAFATEYAAVVLRKSGGSRGEFGPVRTRASEVLPACDSMLSQVQAFIAANPGACAALR